MYIYIKKHYYILEGPNKVHYYCFPLATYKAVLYKRSTVNPPPPFMKVTVFDPFFKKLTALDHFSKHCGARTIVRLTSFIWRNER